MMADPLQFRENSGDSNRIQNDTIAIRIDNELKALVAERYRSGRTTNGQFGRIKAAAGKVQAAIEAGQSN